MGRRLTLAAVTVLLVTATGRAAEPPGATDARAIARAFLRAAPPLVDDVTPDELARARLERQDDHRHGPTVVLVTPRFAVRVALVTREVVAFSRCAACLPLGGLAARCPERAGRLRRRELEARADAFLARRYPGLRRNGQAASAQHGDHASDERSYYARVEAGPAPSHGGAWVHLTLDEATGEVTGLRRSPAPPAPPGGPLAVPLEQAQGRALQALGALGRALELEDPRGEPALVTLRDPSTGEPRRYWTLRAWVQGRRGDACGSTGQEAVTVLVDAVTGRLEVVRS